ncbi:MAG: DUF2441 domain-containing protein [Firmicutes bacterium]|nr:DUF2441 domain-containing protein [Bacillota bacterium]
MKAYRFQSNNISYWMEDETRVIDDYNHHFSYYLRDDTPFRSMLIDLLMHPELNHESYKIEQIIHKITINDFYYFANLFERVKSHDIINDTRRKQYIEKEFGQLIRELCLEEIRKKEYDEYPSRQKSLFCIPNYQGVDYWFKVLINGKKNYQLVELLLDGKFFIGDARFLQGYIKDIENYYRYVAQYWKYPLEAPSIESEIIFQGVAQCIRIIKIGEIGEQDTWSIMTMME